MNRIKVTLGDNDRIALVLPADEAGAFVALLSRGAVFERDGYYAHSGWKIPEKTIDIQFTDGAEFVELDPKVKAAQKEYEEANNARWEEHRKREAVEKELAEAKAAIAALQQLSGCRAPEVRAEEEVL
jgi:hypothetical protein